jgi:hypothetical protein
MKEIILALLIYDLLKILFSILCKAVLAQFPGTKGYLEKELVKGTRFEKYANE